jgi:hypothetical protein
MARKTTVTPEGDLTPAQHELLAVAWDGPAAGRWPRYGRRLPTAGA